MNAVGLQGPGVRYWLDHVSTTCSRPGHGGRQHLGSIGRRLRAGRRHARRGTAGRGGGRGEPLVPEPRGARVDLRSRRRAVGRGDRCDRRMRPSPLGQAQCQHRSDRPGRRSGGRCRRRGGHAASTPCWGSHTTPRRCRRRWVPAAVGCQGAAIHPVAVRAVHDVHRALPDVPIVGVGGVASGWDAVELMLAGASAVQVGTASFADPRVRRQRVQEELVAWAREQGIDQPVPRSPR